MEARYEGEKTRQPNFEGEKLTLIHNAYFRDWISCFFCGQQCKPNGFDFVREGTQDFVCAECAWKAAPELFKIHEAAQQWAKAERLRAHEQGQIQGKKDAGQTILNIIEEPPLERIKHLCRTKYEAMSFEDVILTTEKQMPITNLGEIRAAVEKEKEAERLKYEQPEPAAAPNEPAAAGEITSAELLNAVRCGEDGEALIFTKQNRNKLCFDHAAANWNKFVGHSWRLDKKEESLAAVNGVTELYARESMRYAFEATRATQAGDDKGAAKYHALAVMFTKAIRKLRDVKRKKDVLHLARAGENSLGISGDEWDKKPEMLPVENGVIDQTTGELHEGRPEDYLRASAPVKYEGINAQSPTWQQFLETTFDRDFELINFLARLIGYSITGLNTEAVLAILWGTGRNGKTIFVQAIADMLGPELSGPLEAEFLLENTFTKTSGGPSSDKMYLRGRRYTWISEINENRRLNAGKLKLVTGGDLITGRAPYGKRQTTFSPTHKIQILTNFKPKADARDEALWRRIILIPFRMAFVPRPDPEKPNERLADPKLAKKLHAEKSGILSWAIRGYLDYQKQGLNPPDSVLAATKDYRESEDSIKAFIREKCVEGAGHQVRASVLYAAYKHWQEGNGERAMGANKFGRHISDLYDSIKDRGGKVYAGIDICQEVE